MTITTQVQGRRAGHARERLMGAADTLFYNAHDVTDRYSAQDTIREQANIYLTTGTKLMSTGGNLLLTIVDDTCGRHDTLGGACATESNQVRYEIRKA